MNLTPCTNSTSSPPIHLAFSGTAPNFLCNHLQASRDSLQPPSSLLSRKQLAHLAAPSPEKYPFSAAMIPASSFPPTSPAASQWSWAWSQPFLSSHPSPPPSLIVSSITVAVFPVDLPILASCLILGLRTHIPSSQWASPWTSCTNIYVAQPGQPHTLLSLYLGSDVTTPLGITFDTVSLYMSVQAAS